MTSTEPETTTIEALDFTPGCDAKGGSEIKPSEGNCEHPAEFSAHVHACQPDHPPILLVCKEHLDAGLTYYTRRLRMVKAIRQQPRCGECGLEFQSVEDLIWDVQPIKQHHQQ